MFPGANDKDKTMSNNTILFALYRLGYKGEMTGHGFRGVASTVLYDSAQFEEDWIEMQLAHVQRNKVKGAYNHAKYLKQRTAMMQWWADYVDEQLAKGNAQINGTIASPRIAATSIREGSSSGVKQPAAKSIHALQSTV